MFIILMTEDAVTCKSSTEKKTCLIPVGNSLDIVSSLGEDFITLKVDT